MTKFKVGDKLKFKDIISYEIPQIFTVKEVAHNIYVFYEVNSIGENWTCRFDGPVKAEDLFTLLTPLEEVL